MRALAVNCLCSPENKLSLHCPFAAIPVLRPGALASSSKNNALRAQKPGCAESHVSLTRMSMNESMNLKHKSTAACNLGVQPCFSMSVANGVLALRMGYHEMVEDVGDGIRKLAFSDGNSDNSPRLEKPAHSKSVFNVFFLI